jgi:formate dehydrogenase beta subunit
MTAPVSASQVTAVALATVDDMRERIRRKSKLKGRQADEVSLAEVRALVGPSAQQRDLLI